jgi:hypothetical protein
MMTTSVSDISISARFDRINALRFLGAWTPAYRTHA